MKNILVYFFLLNLIHDKKNTSGEKPTKTIKRKTKNSNLEGMYKNNIS